MMSEARFNPPPSWPVPHGWSPPPDWQPDPSWPPAPPGWTFWVRRSEVEDTEPGEAPQVESTAESTPRRRSWRIPAAATGSILVAAAVAYGGVYTFAHRDSTDVGTQRSTTTVAETRTATVSEAAPTTGWQPPSYRTPLFIDFATWTPFGGIDAVYGGDGDSALLDTHDTTDTWSTKWSGLISPKTTTCAARIVGRVRDVSHVAGIPGGFSIGLATLSEDGPNAGLTGTAVQFDFGMQGFRTAVYPSDSDYGFESAALDRGWHDVEVLIDQTSHVLTVDGRVVAQTQAGGQCGSPVIRVWAGSAEFDDFTVTPLD